MSVPLRVTELHRTYANDSAGVEVLRGVSFEIAAGGSLAVIGPSGSGKSTLLHLIGTLDRPDSGRIEIDGHEPHRLPERELARFRNRTIGFVFQDHHLLPQYSVVENVLLPTLAFRDPANPASAATQRAAELLDRVGLAHRAAHRPAELSGGERQRVAVARALINRPKLLLCDEPTGSLDARSADAVAALLLELHRQEGGVLIVVTHSMPLAERMDRRFELVEGRCIER